MPGLFDTLNLGARSLQAQQLGITVTGHNLANVNNTAYARQRAIIQTGITNQTPIGPVGTGVDAVAVRQIRDSIYDRQIELETSLSSYLDSQKRYLDLLQTYFGEKVDTQNGVGESSLSFSGLASRLQRLFDNFQTLSMNPASLEDRIILINSAKDLAGKFYQITKDIGYLNNIINNSITTDVAKFNSLLEEISNLSNQIEQYEFEEGFRANDLRDLRQQKLEELARYAKINVSESQEGKLNISVNGSLFLSDNNIVDRLEVFESGNGNILVRSSISSQQINLTGGAIQGAIDVRDQIIKTVLDDLNVIASTLINEINQVHKAGFDLNGNTGLDFFIGNNASTIMVNEALVNSPQKIQLSSVAGETTNNQIAISLSQLRTKTLPDLEDMTFTSNYAKLVEYVGGTISDLNSKIEDQNLITQLINQKRSSVSGVSVDEELSELIKFQKAYEASAKLISTIDELLEAVLAMKR